MAALSGLIILALSALVNSLRADAIDGEWCTDEGERIIIIGEYVFTPNGHKIKGEYDTHHFVFVTPSTQLNSGRVADMVLVSADVAYARYTSGTLEEGANRPEVWKRCKSDLS